MAFLNHSIPWHTLSCKLEHTYKNGDQHGKIKFKQAPGQLAQLEHFARKFRDVVEEHGTTEREKFPSPEVYAARAKSWTSSIENGLETTEDISGANEDGVSQKDLERVQRNRALRQMQDALTKGPWSNPIETRMVYPIDFVEKYVDAPHWSSNRKRNTAFLQKQKGRTIQDWIALFEDLAASKLDSDDEPKYWGCPIRRLEHNDVVKMLITDAALSRQIERSRDMTDTILLLAHHPQVDLKLSANQSLSCCPIYCGFDNIGSLAVEAFLYLNLLVSMVDDGTTGLVTPCQTAVVYDDNVERELTTKSHWQRLDYIELLPRPSYMNLRSWLGLMRSVGNEHEHQAEKLLFSLIFFPPGGNDGKATEMDLLSDRAVLKESLTIMWKVIVSVDLIMREIGMPINWEYTVLDTLSNLFGWLPEEHFTEYAQRRQCWNESEGRWGQGEGDDFSRFKHVKA